MGSTPKAEGDAEVRCVPRWLNKNDLRMPRWADDPEQCFKRALFPVSLLRPNDIAKEVDAWVNEATRSMNPVETDPSAFAKLKAYNAIREKPFSVVLFDEWSWS